MNEKSINTASWRWDADAVLCSNSSEALSHCVAPRMFCDICDQFDLHETEDCPQQAMTSDSPPPSHHGGSRDTVRPYCDTCESQCGCGYSVFFCFNLLFFSCFYFRFYLLFNSLYLFLMFSIVHVLVFPVIFRLVPMHVLVLLFLIFYILSFHSCYDIVAMVTASAVSFFCLFLFLHFAAQFFLEQKRTPPLTSTWPHLNSDVGLEEGKY